MTTTFDWTRDLGSLTAEQQQKHIESVSEFLKLDPRLGLLKLTMMDKGDGTRHLVLYASKGATDALRNINDISIIDMRTEVLGGTVVVTAKGINKAGRQEMAVGSISLENKHGKSLEDAFAKAQTRACRRVTLNFTGTGILDESEIFDNTVSIASAPVPLAEIGQPVGASAAPGVDITIPAASPAPGIQLPPPAEERVKNPAVGLKPITNLSAPDGIRREAPAPTTESTRVEIPAPVAPAPVAAPAVEQPAEAGKTRRKRRTKAEMEASRATGQDPKQESTAALAAPTSAPAGPAIAEAEASATPPPIPASEVKTPLIGDKPNAEQMKNYVDKLTNYSDNILPNGGMVPSFGMGPRKKIREFFKLMNAGNDLSQLTVPQWENSFRFLEAQIAEKGDKELVVLIDFNVEKIANGATA